MEQDTLSIEMFGGLRLFMPGKERMEIVPQQTGALLAYLALHLDRQHLREELAEIFWPDKDAETARMRLRHTLHILRRQLEQSPFEKDSILLTTRSTVRLNPLYIRTDVTAFEEAILAAGRACEAEKRIEYLTGAVHLYQGELLLGYYLEDFLQEQRRLADLHWKALQQLRQAHEEAGNIEQALEYGRRAVMLDPLSEESHCALMRLYARTGQPSAMLRQYQEMERILAEQLGTVPSLETTALLQTLRQKVSLHTPSLVSPSGSGGDAIQSGNNMRETEASLVSAVRPRPPSLAYDPASPVLPARAWMRKAILPLFFLLLNVLALSWISLHPRAAVSPNSSSMASEPSLPPSAREIWQARYQPDTDETISEPTAMVTDPVGNIYITGFVRTTKNDVDYLTIKYSAQGKLLWKSRYNGPGNDVDRARSIAVDKAGNVYVTGESDNGKGNGSERLSGLDFATVKYDAQGNQLWVRRYNTEYDGKDTPVKIALDEAGNAYVAGTSMRKDPVNGKPQPCYALLKYDPHGNQDWVRRYEPVTGFPAAAADMQVDRAGNVFITGYVGVTRFVYNLDYLTIKYDTNGNLVWKALYGGESKGNDTPSALALDAQGNVYVTGTGYNGDRANGGQDNCIVTVKYGPRGTQQWVRGYTEKGSSQAHAITVDNKGNIYIAGEILGTGATNYTDFVTVKYDAEGVQQWANRYNGLGSYNDSAHAIAVDADGQVYVTGQAYNGHPVEDNGTAEDFTTLKYSADGRCLWLGIYNGPASKTDCAKAIAIDHQGNVLVTGQSDGGHSFGITTIKYSP